MTISSGSICSVYYRGSRELYDRYRQEPTTNNYQSYKHDREVVRYTFTVTGVLSSCFQSRGNLILMTQKWP